MKNNIKLITDRMFKKQRVLVTALLALVFVGMSVGYAAYYTELKMNGVIAIEGFYGEIGDLDFTSSIALAIQTSRWRFLRSFLIS